MSKNDEVKRMLSNKALHVDAEIHMMEKQLNRINTEAFTTVRNLTLVRFYLTEVAEILGPDLTSEVAHLIAGEAGAANEVIGLLKQIYDLWGKLREKQAEYSLFLKVVRFVNEQIAAEQQSAREVSHECYSF